MFCKEEYQYVSWKHVKPLQIKNDFKTIILLSFQSLIMLLHSLNTMMVNIMFNKMLWYYKINIVLSYKQLW